MTAYSLVDLHDLAAELGCEVSYSGGVVSVVHPDHGTLCTVPASHSLEVVARRVRAAIGRRNAAAYGGGSGLVVARMGGR